MRWEDRLQIGGLSDVGMCRTNNQDASRSLPAANLEQWRGRGHLFLVADGMGAHAVGELASKLAVDSIPHAYHKLSHLSCTEAIARAFRDTNSLIHNRAGANREFQGMGTTSTALLLLPEGAWIAHVGDSRAYRVREGLIEQLSFDHSLVWELMRRRKLTFERARSLVPSNVITRSLGPEPEAQVDVEGPHPVEPGDVFVLCTDGLSGELKDAEIGVLGWGLEAQEACQCLVELANLRGGRDNITVVVVRVEDPVQKERIEEPQPPQKRKPLGKYAPACLLTGIVCALAALMTGWLPGIGVAVASGLATLALVLLVGGGVLYVYSPRGPEPPVGRKPTIYRRTRCPLDNEQLNHFAELLQQLRDLAMEKAWSVDWSKFDTHRRTSERLTESGSVAALQEVRQALHLLAVAQRRHQETAQRLLED